MGKIRDVKCYKVKEKKYFKKKIMVNGVKYWEVGKIGFKKGLRDLVI